MSIANFLSKWEHLVETETDVLSLPYGEKDLRTSPYFSSGTSGFLSVLLLYNSFYQCDISHGCLDKLINGIKIYLTINPGQFEGLMSVGETFLDLYYIYLQIKKNIMIKL